MEDPMVRLFPCLGGTMGTPDGMGALPSLMTPPGKRGEATGGSGWRQQHGGETPSLWGCPQLNAFPRCPALHNSKKNHQKTKNKRAEGCCAPALTRARSSPTSSAATCISCSESAGRSGGAGCEQRGTAGSGPTPPAAPPPQKKNKRWPGGQSSAPPQPPALVVPPSSSSCSGGRAAAQGAPRKGADGAGGSTGDPIMAPFIPKLWPASRAESGRAGSAA